MSDSTGSVDVPGTPDDSGGGLVLNLGETKRLPPWVWRLIFAVAVSVALFQASMSILGKLTTLLGMIAVALFLSFAIEPAVSLLAERYDMKRGLGTFLCFVVVTALTLVFAFVMAELVVSQVQELVDKAPDYLDDATAWANDTFGLDINTGQLNDLLADYKDDIAPVAADVGGRVLSLTGSALGLVFQGFTVLLFAFYMIAQGPTMRRNLCSVLPAEHQRNVLFLWELSIQKTGGWIYSRLVLAAFSAICTWLFLTILGVPSPLALALWVGLISQFIPAIGTYLAGALPVFVALLNDPIDAIWVVGFILLYQQLENYFLSPKITGQTMDLHPAVAFGAAIAGGMLVGPMGAILALPAAGVIQAFVSTFLERHEVVESSLTESVVVQDTRSPSETRRSKRRLVRRDGSATSASASADPSDDEGTGDGIDDIEDSS